MEARIPYGAKVFDAPKTFAQRTRSGLGDPPVDRRDQLGEEPREVAA